MEQRMSRFAHFLAHDVGDFLITYSEKTKKCRKMLENVEIYCFFAHEVETSRKIVLKQKGLLEPKIKQTVTTEYKINNANSQLGNTCIIFIRTTL